MLPAVSKNLVDLGAGQDDYFWNGDATTPLALAGYWASAKMPVTPGAQYTVQEVRSVQFFDADGVRQPSTLYINDAAYATKTFTVPADRPFVAISTTLARKADVMLEAGATASPWEPFGFSLPRLIVGSENLAYKLASLDARAGANQGGLTIHRGGDTLLIRHSHDSTSDLVQPLTLASTGYPPLGEPRVRLTADGWGGVRRIAADTDPGSVWPIPSTLPGDGIHDTSDDIAPISVGSSYVGGNHGWNVVRLTAAAHGKTTADLGSTWSDGSRTYTLLRVVDPATLILSFAHTVDASGRVAVGGTLPQATLTHVAGATNTASLSIAGGRTFDQLRPSSHSRTVTINLDGLPIRDGTTAGRVLTVTESYTVLSYKGIVDYARANVGVDPLASPASLPGLARVTTTWRWEGRTCIVGQTVTAIEPLGPFFMMVTQASGLSALGGSLRQYVPGATGTVAGLDLSTEAPLSGQTDNLTLALAQQVDAADPIARAYQWRFAPLGARDYGIVVGLLPVMDGKHSTRKANGTDSASWFMSNATKKNYPRLTGPTSTLDAGQSRSGLAFRRYLSTEDPPALTVSDGSRAWVMVDSATAVSGTTVLPEVQGRALAVVGSTNVVTSAAYVTPAGVTYAAPASARYIAEAVTDTGV